MKYENIHWTNLIGILKILKEFLKTFIFEIFEIIECFALQRQFNELTWFNSIQIIY